MLISLSYSFLIWFIIQQKHAPYVYCADKSTALCTVREVNFLEMLEVLFYSITSNILPSVDKLMLNSHDDLLLHNLWIESIQSFYVQVSGHK